MTMITALKPMAPTSLAWGLYAEAAALLNQDRVTEAADRLDAALRENPDFPEALSLGGYILERNGKPEAAPRYYQRAIALKPEMPAAWSNLGKLMFRAGNHDAALIAFEAALRFAPDDADLHNSRAGALRAMGRLEDSAEEALEALRLRPGFAEAALNLGAALLKTGLTSEALQAFRMARESKPGFADALNGEALALRALNRLDEARAAFDAAVKLGSREAISGRGCLDLMLGDFERGWEGYEARWLSGKSLREALGVQFPTWTGPGRDGERILVFNDHGLGDTIQFSRYLPLMELASADATFVCPDKLHRLLKTGSKARFVASPPASETFDAQIAISSLPRAFGTRLESVPSQIPYLVAEPELIDKWARRIGEHGFKIGIIWQGNPNPEADMARSFALADLAPLAAIPKVRLISLQKGHGAEQLAHLPTGMSVETLGDSFDAGPDAFVDTAAAMMHLDLVVTCDTSTAHLAGALGRPVWVALKMDAEWRWLRDRADSPWYPTMRLFRQQRIGDWSLVFDDMSERLRRLI